MACSITFIEVGDGQRDSIWKSGSGSDAEPMTEEVTAAPQARHRHHRSVDRRNWSLMDLVRPHRRRFSRSRSRQG